MNAEDVIPLVAIVVAMGLILVKNLLSHQRQMTELVHRVNQQQQPSQESLKVQQDLLDLKQLVHQQTIALDNLNSKLDAQSSTASVRERMVN